MNSFTIYSPGCSGSDQMKKCLQATGMRDVSASHNRHIKNPPNHKRKTLFLYSDPRNLLISYINRGCYDNFLFNHCRNIGGDCSYIDKHPKLSLVKVLKDKYDPLKLEEHFMMWLETSIERKIMMLKYEALENPKTYQKVLDFFGVKEKRNKFPWKPRSSSYLKLPLEQQISITNLFKNLLEIQNKLPDYFIKEKRCIK